MTEIGWSEALKPLLRWGNNEIPLMSYLVVRNYATFGVVQKESVPPYVFIGCARGIERVWDANAQAELDVYFKEKALAGWVLHAMEAYAMEHPFEGGIPGLPGI